MHACSTLPRNPALTVPPLPFLLSLARRDQLEQIPDDIITDPTLQRAVVDCPKCASVGAVFFMAKVTAADERLKLIFVCTNPSCIHKWQD